MSLFRRAAPTTSTIASYQKALDGEILKKSTILNHRDQILRDIFTWREAKYKVESNPDDTTAAVALIAAEGALSKYADLWEIIS